MALKDRLSYRGRFGNGTQAGPGRDVAQEHHASRGTTVLREASSPRPSEFHFGVSDGYRVYNVTDDYSAGDRPASDSELEWFAEGEPSDDVDMSIAPTVTINPPRPRTLEAGYNEDTGILRIRFREGAVYDYEVDPETWESLQAERVSTGKWMFRNGLGGLGSGTRIE